MKKYITERNGRSSWEWQGIIAFRTCQWNDNECVQLHVSIEIIYAKFKIVLKVNHLNDCNVENIWKMLLGGKS